MGSPQRSPSLEVVSRVDCNAVTLQDASAHLTSAMVGIDEENFLVIANRATTKRRWLAHADLPKLKRVPRRLERILSPGGVQVKENGKAPIQPGLSMCLGYGRRLSATSPPPISYWRLAPFTGRGWKLRIPALVADFAGRGRKFFVRSGSRTLRGLGGKRRVFHAPFLALELPGRAVQRRSTPLWRAVGCALVESRACIDRSSNRPIRSALACRSGRFHRRAETFCVRSTSLTRVVHR